MSGRPYPRRTCAAGPTCGVQRRPIDSGSRVVAHFRSPVLSLVAVMTSKPLLVKRIKSFGFLSPLDTYRGASTGPQRERIPDYCPRCSTIPHVHNWPRGHCPTRPRPPLMSTARLEGQNRSSPALGGQPTALSGEQPTGDGVWGGRSSEAPVYSEEGQGHLSRGRGKAHMELVSESVDPRVRAPSHPIWLPSEAAAGGKCAR